MKTACRGGLVNGLRIVAAASALSAAFATHADVRADPVGGGGGGAFAARCPYGQFLTGVELRTGDDVDAIRPLCVLAYDKTKTSPVWVSSDASASRATFLWWWTGRDAFSVTSVFPNPGLVVVGDRLWYGGGGGRPRSLVCPIYLPIMLGLRIEAEGESTVIVHKIDVFCGFASNDQPKGDTYGDLPRGVGWEGKSATRYRPPNNKQDWEYGPNHVQGSSMCPADRVAVGIHGRSGAWLDAVGIICDFPMWAPPPPGSVKPPPKKNASGLPLDTKVTSIETNGQSNTAIGAALGHGSMPVVPVTPADRIDNGSAFKIAPPQAEAHARVNKKSEIAAQATTPNSAFARTTVASSEPTKVAAAAYAASPIAAGGSPSAQTRVTILPQQPSVNALVTLKADGVSHHCDGVSLHFGDGTPEEFVQLRGSRNAVGSPQQFERSHKFGKPGTYTIEALGRSGDDKCPHQLATLRVVVK